MPVEKIRPAQHPYNRCLCIVICIDAIETLVWMHYNHFIELRMKILAWMLHFVCASKWRLTTDFLMICFRYFVLWLIYFNLLHVCLLFKKKESTNVTVDSKSFWTRFELFNKHSTFLFFPYGNFVDNNETMYAMRIKSYILRKLYNMNRYLPFKRKITLFYRVYRFDLLTCTCTIFIDEQKWDNFL